MKILAIRGKNLASLSAEFEVNYQTEPLRSAGLYAITGPTGAGKSTLLDALCLALYEKTPRLRFAKTNGENIPDVGENDISPGDTRTILRRGAGEGYAEVDFIGSDGVAYRSRWSVRRARIKGDGKLQASEMTFTRIADRQALGDQRKTETLKRIEKAIGLSFEQFTRAVLLAQNDFAAFLKASDDERAELLQTLTGTSQFSDLSVRAYQRMKDEKNQLEQLNIQLEMQAPLSADLRAAHVAQAQSKSLEVKDLGTEKTALEDQLRWHQNFASLTDAVNLAKYAQTAAELEKHNAQPRKTELFQIDQVQEARPLRHAQQRLQAELEKYQVQTQQASLALDDAAMKASAHAAELTAAQALTASAETDHALAQPQLDQAKALDVQINTLQAPMAAALEAKNQAVKMRDVSQTQLSEKQTQLQQAQAEHAQTEQWLAQHLHLRPLADGWQRFETLFAQAGNDLAKQAKARTQQVFFTHKAESLASTLISVEQALGIAKNHYDAAVETLIASGQALALFHAPQMFEKKQIFNQRREQVVTALALWMRIHTQKTNSNQLEQQSQTQLVSVSKIESELQAAQALAPMLARDCASVEQTLQIAQLVASESAEGLREQLQAGLACPVCGGLEHPYAVHLPYQDAVLIALKNNVTNKRNESQALITRIGILSSTLSSAQIQLEQLSATRLVSDNTTLKFQAEWVQHAMHAELALVTENEIQVCLDSALVVITSDLGKLTAQEIGFQKALQEKETLQVTKDKSQLALQSQKETFDSLTQEQKINHQALQSVVKQIAELTPQIESTLLLISNGFVDARWQESWRQDASTFVAQCRKDVFSWNSKQKNSVEFFSHIQLLGNALESLTLALKKNIQTLTDQSDQCSHQELVLQIIREKRKALFDGKSTQDIEANFNNAVALARQAQTNFQLLSQQASSQHTRLVEVTRQSVAQVVSSNYELSQAQTNFDVWCDSFQSRTDVAELGTSCSLEHLQRWLDVPLAWVVTERIELQEIDTALASAQAVLTQQSLNLTRHQAVCSTSEDVLSVANKLSELEKTLLAVSEALTALRIALAEDDKRLGATNDLRLKIQLQSTRTDLWARLGELIGSADGKKFRNFAQQMTLDILLGYANSHLQSLTKRYRLQRIKNSLGLLVVDQDMGDEVRSVHSLSGGESFLVSLALALGLASLSSHQVRVESLFIDEGFGSLDADALLLAMEALDKLQAQGRKVGVISHVQEMTERINTRVQVQRMAGGVSKVVVS